MEPIIIYPKNPRQYAVIRALLEEMKVKFKMKDETLMTEKEFYAKINRAAKQAEAGKKIKLTPEIEKELFEGVL